VSEGEPLIGDGVTPAELDPVFAKLWEDGAKDELPGRRRGCARPRRQSPPP
jgi:hypothetical protein